MAENSTLQTLFHDAASGSGRRRRKRSPYKKRPLPPEVRAKMADARKRVKALEKRAGEYLRELRVLHGLTQTELAELLGVTYQQLHKYETNANKLGLSRLQDICGLFDLTPKEFYAGLDKPKVTLNHSRMILFVRQNAGIIETLNEKHFEGLHQLCVNLVRAQNG